MLQAIEYNAIVKLFQSQARSTQIWVNEWEKHKDASAVRNASLAIGKLHGIYNILLNMNGGEKNIDEELIALLQKYNNLWSQM